MASSRPKEREGGDKITGWMQSSELQRRAAGNAVWLERLRGKARVGWSVLGMQWQPSSNKTWNEGSSGWVVPANAGGG